MAVTYIRVTENLSENTEVSLKEISRAPAAIKSEVQEECEEDLPARFNSHLVSNRCN